MVALRAIGSRPWMLERGRFSERAASIVPAARVRYADDVGGIRDRSAFPAANDVAPRPGCPGPADCSAFEVHKGGLGEAVTGRIAIGIFAMFMPLGSNTIRRNALRLLRPTRAKPVATDDLQNLHQAAGRDLHK